MTKEKYMALADLQTVWTNSLKPWIAASFIAVTAVADGATAKLVLQDGTLLEQSTFQPAGSYVLASEKGTANGVATLDATGKVPSSQLPSYVDDVIEAANFASLPATGEGGKIYVTLDGNKTYRWGGSAYVEISASIALGETAGTAYEGSKGKALKDAFDTHEADTDIHVTTTNKADWDAKYDKPGTGIPKSDLAADVQTSLGKADTALQDEDIEGKADLVTGATAGNFAGLDANGNLTDSGKKASDFQAAGDYKTTQTAVADPAASGTAVEFIDTISQNANGEISATKKTVSGASSSAAGLQSAAHYTKVEGIEAGAQVNIVETVKVNGVALTPDANKAVDVEFEIPERVTAQELAAFVV